MLTVRTDRLLLRPFGLGDAAGFAGYRSEVEVARFQSWDAPYSVESARALIGGMVERVQVVPGEWNQVAVEREGELIGDCAFRVRMGDEERASVGFTLARAHWGKGYATEAVRGLVGELFRMGLRGVVADCDARNVRSQRVLERVGLRRVGVRSVLFKGECVEELEFEMGRGVGDQVVK